MLITILKYIVLVLLLLALVVFVSDRVFRSKKYKGPTSDHFNGSRFYNIKDPQSTSNTHSLGDFFRLMLSREMRGQWDYRTVEQTKPADRVEGSELVATFVNHTTVLIQIEGLNILTDPIYAKRASPFSFIGPHRFADPGVAFHDLPKIDLVLISHNHYDHLDISTLKRLAARDNPRIIIPLGNSELLQRHGIQNSQELDWWQNIQIADELGVTCVPAQHFSARAISDRNRSLWAGFVVHTPAGDIYFAGDTGFGPFLGQIGERFPNGFRLGLLPIGAYRPEWFMGEVHVSPDEAFKMQDLLNIKNVMATHFGTFNLAGDGQDESADRIRELVQAAGDNRNFVLLQNGENMRLE